MPLFHGSEPWRGVAPMPRGVGGVGDKGRTNEQAPTRMHATYFAVRRYLLTPAGLP